MKEILITGGAGFIGTNLTKKLVKKYKVTVLEIPKKYATVKDLKM